MKLLSLFLVFLLVVLLSECKQKKAAQSTKKQKSKNKEKLQVKVDEIEKPSYPSLQTFEVKAEDLLKPQYPSYSRKSKNDSSTTKNETLMQCAQRVLGQSALASLLASASAAGFGSSSFLGGLGFTTGGVGAGSFAAWIHSIIGLAKTGTFFAKLQSLGALGAGIFGTAFIPVTLGAGGISPIVYMCSQCDCYPLNN